MTEERKHNESETPRGPDTGCKGCSQEDACRKVWSTTRKGPFTPTGLSLSSALVFLLPIATAITAGAVVKELTKNANHSTLIQALAACGGLVLGAFVAWLFMPVIRKRFYERRTKTNHSRD